MSSPVEQGRPDTSVTKVSAAYSPRGEMGQGYLASGKRLSMRLWEEDPGEPETLPARAYETVGFVISGRAELRIQGQTLVLAAGDSWVVPMGVEHGYHVLEPFVAVEATSPPAEVRGRDAAPD
jgi:quercetin dioxygenase-like cupin family protein